jgi:hypothetical protein
MKKLTTALGLVIFALLILTPQSLAQQREEKIGKIFNKREANILFGKVIASVEVKKSVIRAALRKTKKHMLFNMKNGRPVVTDERRRALIDNMEATSEKDIFAVFSTSVVQEFLDKDDSPTVLIERRAGVMSLSTESNVLEFSTTCPPFCIDPPL